MESLQNDASNAPHCTEFMCLSTVGIKDEPQDDPEVVESYFESNSATEELVCDPMNLLELTNERAFFEDRPNMPQPGRRAEIQDGASASTSDRPLTPSDAGWMEWLTQYPWLLLDEEDSTFFYCLYCDVNVKANSSYFVVTHEKSAGHKEFADTYVQFKTTEQEASLSSSTVEIKQEFGTSSSLAAIKLKRKSQSEVLLNFSWRRWIATHPWLERVEGTLGHCRYCRIKLNVEMQTMRMRHEEGKNHQLAVRGKLPATNFSKRDETHAETEDDDDDVPASNESCRNSGFRDCFKPLKGNPDMCRCRICHVTLAVSSVRKHLKTQMHIHKMRHFKKKQHLELNRMRRNRAVVKEEPALATSDEWSMYREMHPWLIADPKDATHAFCKYCAKRLPFAHSRIKRQMHEQSVNHAQAVEEFKKKNNKCDRSSSADDDGAGEGQQEDAEEESDEKNANEEDSENDLKSGGSKANRRHTDEWYQMYPWCRRDQKDTNYYYCTYCQIKLATSLSRRKHEGTSRHRMNAKRHKLAAKNQPKRQYPWVVEVKSNKNYIYCKYCRLRYKATMRRYKHELSERHQLSAAAFIEAQKRNMPSARDKSATETKNSMEKVPKTLHGRIKLWRANHPWLSFKRDEPTPNYGYCLCCEQRVYLTSVMYVYKHERSQHHIATWKNWLSKHSKKINKSEHKKKTTSEQSESADEQEDEEVEDDEEGDDEEEQDEAEEDEAEEDEAEEDEAEEDEAAEDGEDESAPDNTEKEEGPQHLYSWVLPDPRNEKHYGFCKYCKTRLMVKSIFKMHHEQTKKHKIAREAYMNAAESASEMRDKAAVDPNASQESDENDVVDVESVKSEVSRDDTGLLEFMLRRAKGTRRRKRSIGGPPEKRPKLADQSAIEIARRLTAAHTELINLSRSFDTNNERNERRRLSSSPQSIVACLARFQELPQKMVPSESKKAPTQPVRPLPSAAGESDSAQSAIVQSESVQTESVTVEPTPVESAAVEATPVQSVTVEPTPVQSVAVEPTLAQSVTVEPTLVQSATVEPTPVQSATVEPMPVQSAAVAPAPVELAPSQQTQSKTFPQPIGAEVHAIPHQYTVSSLCPLMAAPINGRNTFDLFFDSVSETVKRLPPDLAAEGRMKIMQIVYALEMRSLRRRQPTDKTKSSSDGTNASGSVNIIDDNRAFENDSDDADQIQIQSVQNSQTKETQPQSRPQQQQQFQQQKIQPQQRQQPQQQLLQRQQLTQQQQSAQLQRQQPKPQKVVQTAQLKPHQTQQKPQHTSQQNQIAIRLITSTTTNGNSSGHSSAQSGNNTPITPGQQVKEVKTPTVQTSIRRIQMNPSMQIIQRNQTGVRYFPATTIKPQAGGEVKNSETQNQSSSNGGAVELQPQVRTPKQFKWVQYPAPQQVRKLTAVHPAKTNDGVQQQQQRDAQ